MNSNPIHIVSCQLMLYYVFCCILVMSSRHSASGDQKKLAIFVFRQFCSNKGVELLKKLGVNPSVWNDEGSSDGYNDLIRKATPHKKSLKKLAFSLVDSARF